MKAPTHASFSLFFLFSIGLLVGISATLPTIAWAIIGGLLPDIDTQTSTIGRLCMPLSRFIERKLGHRGATHSLLALIALGVITAPLLAVNRLWWFALLAGYLSHLLLDTLNREGAPLFYPSPVRAVMQWNIPVGSKGEIALFTVFSLLVLILLPINRAGLFTTLHTLLKDVHSAIADYRSWENTYRVYAEVKGVLNISQQPIERRFEVLGIENANSLVVYDAQHDTVHTVGTDKNANIYPKRIVCQKGEPIEVITTKIHLENELLANLLTHLPQAGASFLKGTVKTTNEVLVSADPDTYSTIKLGINELDLRYARKKDLDDVHIRTIFVLSGDIYVRTILAPGLLPPHTTTTTTPKATPRAYTTEIYIHNVKNQDEIKVKEGQEITVGDVIAELSDTHHKTRQVEASRLTKQMSTLQAQETKISKLFITHTRKRLAEIQEEEEKKRIYSPVNARVLLIRTHTIHDNNRTIIIKLLVTDVEP